VLRTTPRVPPGYNIVVLNHNSTHSDGGSGIVRLNESSQSDISGSLKAFAHSGDASNLNSTAIISDRDGEIAGAISESKEKSKLHYFVL
jgi:hypothetical protein